MCSYIKYIRKPPEKFLWDKSILRLVLKDALYFGTKYKIIQDLCTSLHNHTTHDVNLGKQSGIDSYFFLNDIFLKVDKFKLERLREK